MQGVRWISVCAAAACLAALAFAGSGERRSPVRTATSSSWLPRGSRAARAPLLRASRRLRADAAHERVDERRDLEHRAGRRPCSGLGRHAGAVRPSLLGAGSRPVHDHARREHRTRVTDNCPISESTPAWSPSGEHIVFSRFGNLWSMRADGTESAELTCDPGEADYWPNWSPDGSRIAFDRGTGVFLMAANGDDVQRLATGQTPSFSPDGTRIAYAGESPGPPQGIYVMAADGTGSVRLTTGYDTEPVWSPDGTRIAFVHLTPADAPLSFVIETMKSDGGDPTVVMASLNATRSIGRRGRRRPGASPT